MILEALVAKIAAMKAEAKRQQRELVTKLTFIAEAKSKEETPVSRRPGHPGGNLRRSENSRIVSDTEGRVGTKVFYARFVHDGTYKMAANPYFTRGLERTKVEAEPLLKAAGEHIVGKVAGS